MRIKLSGFILPDYLVESIEKLTKEHCARTKMRNNKTMKQRVLAHLVLRLLKEWYSTKGE